MEIIGAIDQGTQSTRFSLFDKDVNLLASHQVSLNQICTKPGWCEHDPVEIIQTVKTCMEMGMRKVVEKVGDVTVKAIGITNQRETTIVWDKITGRPMHNAIVWLDGRTSETCRELENRYKSKDYFRQITGLPISTYFSGVKLKWLMDNVPDIQQAVSDGACCFGTVDSWIIFNLTGKKVHATDVTNASRTMLMDLKTEKWHSDTLRQLEINPAVLPEIKSNCEVFGIIKEGPLAGIPISGSLGDQQAALLGHRCQMGEAKNTYGTGCFLLLNTGDQLVASTHGLITGIGYKLGPGDQTQYMLEGSIAIAGSIFSWLKDNLGVIESIDEVEELAKTVEDSGGVYFVPAFGGLLAPHWRDDARGVIVGLTGYTNKAHIVRAAMEAICFQTCEVLEAMKLDASLDSLRTLKVDGGASRNHALMQIQADLLQTVVSKPENVETSSVGAGIAAGITVGFYDKEQLFGVGEKQTVEFRPEISSDQARSQFAKWKLAIDKSLELSILS